METEGESRFSHHAEEMLAERSIDREWVEESVTAPETVEHRDDETTHYLRRIKERGGRWLRVVVSQRSGQIVTVFFDRRVQGDP